MSGTEYEMLLNRELALRAMELIHGPFTLEKADAVKKSNMKVLTEQSRAETERRVRGMESMVASIRAIDPERK